MRQTLARGQPVLQEGDALAAVLDAGVQGHPAPKDIVGITVHSDGGCQAGLTAAVSRGFLRAADRAWLQGQQTSAIITERGTSDDAELFTAIFALTVLVGALCKLAPSGPGTLEHLSAELRMLRFCMREASRSSDNDHREFRPCCVAQLDPSWG